MNIWIVFILVSLALANLLLLGTSRVRTCIRVVAFQGVALGLLPLLAWQSLGSRAMMAAFISIVLKGAVFPWFLFRALRGMTVRRETLPFVGYTLSIIAGISFIVIGLWLELKAPLPEFVLTSSKLALPIAFATILTGLFIIITRKKALNQLLGYLVLENGIFAFAFVLDIEAGFLVEMGILLDAFFAVVVMGVAMTHIHRVFNTIDSDMLSSLKDSTT